MQIGPFRPWSLLRLAQRARRGFSFHALLPVLLLALFPALAVSAAAAQDTASAPTTTALTQVAAQAGGTLQFQVVVTSSAGTPAGTPAGIVQLLCGSLSLGSATLGTGSAIFAVAPSALGASAVLTAQYMGAPGYASSTSMSLAASGGTAGTGGSTSTGLALAMVPTASTPTLSSGGASAIQLSVSATGGATFSNPVDFSVTGLPQGVTAVFSPATLPAGSTSQQVALSLHLAAATGSITTATADHAPCAAAMAGGSAISLACLLVPWGLLSRRRLPQGILALTCLAICGLVSGCGVTPGATVVVPENATFQITAASGAITQTVQAAIVIEQPVSAQPPSS